MTSEVSNVETSEFLRRRKLRLQQVREQSKDIAKKIRQRAKLEKIRQVVELDAIKHRDYIKKQDEFVQKLEEYCARGIKNVGVSHRNAVEASNLDGDNNQNNIDIAKQRGKEAAAELRRKKQEKLDEQKKLLDRKLQARETANELSREKGVTVTNKLSKPTSDMNNSQTSVLVTDNANEDTNNVGAQWELDEQPNEWIPNIPVLSLPKDDNEFKESINVETKSDKSKRMDLFALSDEMPNSLRGGLATETRDSAQEQAPIKPSLTLVSEYLQNRGLRLRESEKGSNKNAELQNLRQTILRSKGINELCLVHDDERVPVPTWQAENHCKICQNRFLIRPKLHSNFNLKMKNDMQSFKYCDISPSPVLRGISPFIRERACCGSSSALKNVEKLSKTISGEAQSGSGTRKSSVTIYNHATRDTRDIPRHDEGLVIRDEQNAEDAYSQAMKATSNKKRSDKDVKKLKEMRTKVAMTRQSVEKEYRDTINFLNSLPKDGGDKPNRRAYMDASRQELQRQNKQKKMQDEFQKIQWECKKHTCRNKCRSKTKTPTKDDELTKDLQYSWMPVPESDENLAIHTIPTSLKEGKPDSGVKFSNVDSYHEYRSRHKHTPPTKETPEQRSQRIDIESDPESSDSEMSSGETFKLHKKRQSKDSDLSDAEKIIIYKILEAKSNKRHKNKLLKDILKQLTEVDKSNTEINDNNIPKQNVATSSDSKNKVTFGQVNEGIYKAVNQTTANGDNITTMYYSAKEGDTDKPDHDHTNMIDKGTTPLQWESGETPHVGQNYEVGCQCGCIKNKNNLQGGANSAPSASTSASSFKTAATNCRLNAPEPGFIKLVDESGEEAGKFFIGASGFVKDNAYEVVIQLRKKDEKKDDKVIQYEEEQKTSPKQNLPEVPSTTEIAPTAQATASVSQVTTATQSEVQITTDHVNRNELESQPLNSEVSNNEKPNVISNQESVQNLQKSVAEKGVCTSFQGSITACDIKSDYVARPATSTYTQTTDSPPTNRPTYLHMSSTSTAYMSPPDMILPNFLKPGYKLADDDLNDPKNFEIINKVHEYNFGHECECRCRKCAKGRDSFCTFEDNYRKTHQDNSQTPPNTAASRHSKNYDYNIHNMMHNHEIKKSKHKCRKCKSRNELGETNKVMSKKPKLCSKNLRSIFTKTTTTPLNNINRLTSRTSKSKLNPIIKDYVNKLLDLNRESLRAVQVIHQDCSPVPTPGSSIINIEQNTKRKVRDVEDKISLEQIKDMVVQKILEEIRNDPRLSARDSEKNSSKHNFSSNSKFSRIPRKKIVHKVKSLNISKNLLQTNKVTTTTQSPNGTSTSSNKTSTDFHEQVYFASKLRNKSSAAPEMVPKLILDRNKNTSEKSTNKVYPNDNNRAEKCKSTNSAKVHKIPEQRTSKSNSVSYTQQGSNISSTESELFAAPAIGRKNDSLTNISTQTSTNFDSELNFVKIAEDKIQNMEKIADLTEKCTLRLSNLAKVLEEVRKNKTLAYSQIVSDTDSDQKSDKNESNTYKYSESNNQVANLPESKQSENEYPNDKNSDKNDKTALDTDYIPFLSNIPKPPSFKTLTSSQLPTSSSNSSRTNSPDPDITETPGKKKAKPPPALSRIHLKHGQNKVVPHELSTVVEVDSPMSVKQKSQASRIENKLELEDYICGKPDDSNEQKKETTELPKEITKHSSEKLIRNIDDPNQETLVSLTKDISDDSKMQMIDLKQFNEIMLKPFFSIHEYAKHCNIEKLDDGSNLDEINKEGPNEELSSLHSDGSLPDVISELLKRNLISEPFKFDTGSNLNSTTASSESTLSVLALSKARKEKKKSSVMFPNKENIEETSDTLSISSNPDLESAFKKLGMGWASSTLKKTKERLALSSSSNTSSSSMSHFKIKRFNHEIPALVTDTVSSVLNSCKPNQKRNVTDSAKNAEQQTTLTNSMTVKEFLNNELAKKITFTNKSINETEEEFVSLFETKMPDEMKHSSQLVREEHSINNSMRSGNNRARTSTPVQLFKSITYHSSSSSNVSNGLFSNADELSSVKVTSNSMKHSTSDKDDLTIPNFSLKLKKCISDCSKSD